MSEYVETWTRTLRRPQVHHVRPARRDLFAMWNRYGGIPGTPHKGVTIGWGIAYRGHGLSIVWARPYARVEEVA